MKQLLITIAAVVLVGCIAPEPLHRRAGPGESFDHVEMRNNKAYKADAWRRKEHEGAIDENERIRNIYEFRKDRRRQRGD